MPTDRETKPSRPPPCPEQSTPPMNSPPCARRSRSQSRADELRDILLAEGADLKGDQYTANIIPGVRETLDRKAIDRGFRREGHRAFRQEDQLQDRQAGGELNDAET